MTARSVTAFLVVLVLVLAACDDASVELSTTSSVLSGTTEPPAADTTTTTTVDDGEDTTSTTLRGETVGTYEVAARLSDENGETLYIVIPPGAYTDVDLENFIGDLKEADPELWGAEVFDDPAAVESFQVAEDERSAEQQVELDDHHLISLLNGDTVRFQGPFKELGEYVIGS